MEEQLTYNREGQLTYKKETLVARLQERLDAETDLIEALKAAAIAKREADTLVLHELIDEFPNLAFKFQEYIKTNWGILTSAGLESARAKATEAGLTPISEEGKPSEAQKTLERLIRVYTNAEDKEVVVSPTESVYNYL